jgi:hypothetical protein
MGPEPAPSIFGIDSSTYDTNQTAYFNDFPAAHSLGARWDRMTVGANAAAGNFSQLDYLLTKARQNGMGVVLSFSGFAGACSSGTTPVSGCMPSSPTDIANYQAFMKTLILRYRNVVDYYESWIEPNNPAIGGSSDPARYAALLKAQYAEVQALNSQYGLHVKLLLGSPIGFTAELSSNPQVFPWLDALLTDLGNAHVFDGATLHAYRLSGSRVYGPDEAGPDYVGSLTFPAQGCSAPVGGVCNMTWPQELSAYESIFASHGYATVPLWLTEFGWPGENPSLGGAYDLNQTQQRDDLNAAYADLLKLSFVQGAMWFNIRDYQPGSPTGDPEEFFYMGLLNYNTTQKPAAAAFAANAAANPSR